MSTDEPDLSEPDLTPELRRMIDRAQWQALRLHLPTIAAAALRMQAMSGLSPHLIGAGAAAAFRARGKPRTAEQTALAVECGLYFARWADFAGGASCELPEGPSAS